ncbi:DUF4396 domain-containing protein [Variovorax sp. RA8]|uniref:DUF4396 domain-containing protein n=1 Tax=Variovorax sp. (strain JCM 16519 / RA8) TaxID=662548 RepID=UPI001318B7B6|nr:DUF4396 domain-containing protein [Variovorax sp. RA8]VTU44454.1 Copper resistance protein A precursor [Variovorax sp. RA8]
MFAQPVDYFLAVWFVLAALSTAYVAWDQFRNNPEPVVMKWGFILVTLYMGPLGLLLYVMADKEPAPGEHEEFVKPLWKQGVGSTIHCVAGDATGIILAAVITAVLGLPMWIDLIVEYAAGFAFGLFIFQSLFMKSMMGGTYWENVRKSFMPEFISMNAMMAGMAPVMALLMMGRDMRAMDPTELLFWGVMSLGVIAGFAVAYPVNVWMVARQMKHGLMTERKPKERSDSATALSSHGQPHDAEQIPAHAGQLVHASHSGLQHATSESKSPDRRAHDKHQAHGGHSMRPNVTRPQLAAVTMTTTLMLLGGMTIPALFVNMRLSARDVGGAIMPPSMIMGWDTPGQAMRDMAAIHPREVTRKAKADARGDAELVPELVDGVKVFNLETRVIRWNILPDETVEGYAFNDTIPGPRIRLTEGDRVRIKVTNRLPESTTVHWHGLILPNEMDGPAKITQKPIPPGGSYTYEFTTEQAGTFFYHTHDHVDRQQAFGLYGALIIDPKNTQEAPKADHEYVLQLQEWLKREGLTYPAMLMEGALPNFFTINGKAYPATDTVKMKVGETIKLRFIGSNNNFVHPMHVHGGPFTVVARDGYVLSEAARFDADTVNVGPGQRYDVIWKARRPGKWLVHCHIPHHTTNNNVEHQGGGGLTMILEVEA